MGGGHPNGPPRSARFNLALIHAPWTMTPTSDQRVIDMQNPGRFTFGRGDSGLSPLGLCVATDRIGGLLLSHFALRRALARLNATS